VRVVHAQVRGRLRVRIARLRGDRALARAVEQRFCTVSGVRAAGANPLTASVLLAYDPALEARSLLPALERVWADLSGSWQPPTARPAHGSSVPLPGAEPSAAPNELADATPWHRLSSLDALARMESGPDGLSAAEVVLRRARHGTNALPAPPRRSKLSIFGAQLTSVPVAMLGVSALLSVSTGGIFDAVAILAVVIVNASIGYVTENNAERIINAIGEGALLDVEVVRGGARQRVAPDAIVPGDILVLGAGAFVAADARLLEADALVIDESALTGESLPVHKSELELEPSRVALADRRNMVFRGTLVTGGSGRALVVATGKATQIGLVQSLVTSVVQRETPLQVQLRELGLQLAVVAGSVCGAVFGIGLLRGYPLLQMLRTSISLAVAAIPEGLPTVAITTLALGIRRLAQQRVLVRQLNAVETLGAIQVMCLDKTGTITINRMSAVEVFVGLQSWPVETCREAAVSLDCSDLEALLRVAVLCSEVVIEHRGGVPVLHGSATESALVQLAIDSGMDASELLRGSELLARQFRSEGRSYMATLHRPAEPLSSWPAIPSSAAADTLWLSVKGRSPEVLGLCGFQLVGGRICELTDEARRSIATASERMAGRALRVLGFAAGRWSPQRAEGGISLAAATDLIWLGLVGMSDPPREGMRELLQRFHAAGMRTVMITGDQSATAQAIGKAVGLSGDEHLEILDSTELQGIAPEVLRALAQRIHVFSRVSPAHKLQIVHALQSAGYTVAMTGDGINDSPALRAADVGVAMGGSGTSAAREVADVVLEDDNLETLIDGIAQGRAIYDNIKKAVHFILSTNLSEILLTFLGIAAGVGETLTPMQLLWINLLSDVFPELALAVQPPESDVLRRAPRDPARPMFDRADLARVVLQGGVLTAGPLAAYGYGRARYGAGPRSVTLAFTVLSITQLLHVLSSRSQHHSIFDRERLPGNRYIPMALGGGLALQVLATIVPGARRLLGVVPLGLADWGVVMSSAMGPLLVNETIKLMSREPQPTAAGAAPRVRGE
jgi:Ca2+-transporting ATPase